MSTKKSPRKNTKKPKTNREILLVTYLFVGLFVCLGGYFTYFLTIKSDEVINNSYNARLDRFADRIVRGKILSSDGTVLAETKVDEAGGESRYYPYGARFAHVVGFSTKGKAGLESLGNFYLLSSHINIFERVVNELSEEKSTGDDLVTTLNLPLQQVAYDALGDRKGAVVVMEPDTGKILAMVSKPDFDPNQIDAQWNELVASDNREARLYNRATQGLYPPGSTFKIVTLLEYLREHPEDYNNYSYNCNGKLQVEDYEITCFNGAVHGEQNLQMVFANSCNGAFASMGLELNLASYQELCNQLLFNANLSIPIAYTKSSFNLGGEAATWDILQTAIGQGITQITPLHNAMITAAIANGGVLMKPYFMDHVQNINGDTIKKFMPSAQGELMTASESALLTEFMRLVVTDGTGSAVKTDAYSVAGKTGSAEFDSSKDTHAWFVGFSPVESPKIVVSVIVEESGSGGKVAAPIARRIMDSYFGFGG